MLRWRGRSRRTTGSLLCATDGGLRYADAKMEGMEEESKRRTFPSVIDVAHGSVRSPGSTG